MKILRPLLLLAVAAALNCGAQKIDPVTQAVLKGYSELIEQNPNDYETLYERASQYLQLGMYNDAMQDIRKALELTPQKNNDLREREYSMLSSAAAALGDYDTALTAVESALALNSDSYFNVFKKGNILLEMNRPQEAYRAFSSLQSLKSRSQEAYYGMARACIRQGNFSEADTLMKEIENAAPTNPQTFVRLGRLFEEMNQPENAAANYIVAISMDDRGNTGMQELSDLASGNYKAVASALNFAIEKSDNKPMMLYLKGILAKRAGAYPDAEECFTRLTNIPDGKTSGVYASLAESLLAQNELTAAMEAINQAITLQQAPAHYNLKARIEMAMENTHGAIADASEAIRLSPNDPEAYITGATAYILANQGEEATVLLNQAIMTAPDNVEALLLRAYTNQELKKNAKGAIADLNRISLETTEAFRDITIQTIARAKAGKKLDADAMMEQALSSSPSPEEMYWGAVYYAQTGNLDKAKELADQAVFDGFLNKHLLKSSRTPWLNLLPISHLLK